MASSQRQFTPASASPKVAILIITALAATLLAGCGLFGGAEESPTPMPTRTPFADVYGDAGCCADAGGGCAHAGGSRPGRYTAADAGASSDEQT